MTTAAVEALRADHEALSTLAQSFTDDEWATPSRCEGWTVRDLLAHMTQLFRQVVDPASLPPGHPSGSVERTQDVWVAALRDVPVQQVLDDYRALGEKAIAALAGLQGNDTPLDLGELGTHPIHLVANAFAFDHYTHIRVDLLAPTGPLDRPAPPADEAQLTAVTDWIVAGLPQMSPAAAAEPVELVLTGPGGRTVRYGTGAPAPAEADGGDGGGGESESGAKEEAPAGAAGEPDGRRLHATVTTSTTDLVLWATRREPWRDLVTIDGDTATGTRFCDAVHVF